MNDVIAYGFAIFMMLFFGGIVLFFWIMACEDDAEQRRRPKPRFETWDSESQDEAINRQPPFLTHRLARPGTLDQAL
jgi:hypothetical protein